MSGKSKAIDMTGQVIGSLTILESVVGHTSAQRVKPK